MYWATVGIEPLLTQQQGKLAVAVNGTRQSITDVQQGKDCLRQCFAEKQALLILDDLWNAADAKVFAALDEGSRLLLTINDGYYLQQLAYYFAGAERESELQALLLNFDWLQRMLTATGVNSRILTIVAGD
ncbi:MAG: hypothetical protein AAFW95_05800 [Cyanobacteria bacterium J06638_6]